MKKSTKSTKNKKNPNPKQKSQKSAEKSKSKKNKNPNSKFSKPSTQIVDYFPRGSGPKNDFTSNIGVIDPSKKPSFLSKKRKQNKSLKSDKNQKKS
jgi:hypothetical protein